ncbi:hypothetical protein CAPTEDRAFT_224236 [Capitella teleta]|uniref:Integrin beta subunit tail domain-containing protein n=1 Tax=Capitella teleta TaxID=283909 RepID=R7V6W5_CAPTE|nr:hypothetical protein CAPTEDRAFT_224236 [Capitella teleta]|eukprot:ELU12111.1 hypothetical protein CAPTEDRAFT_224236 [Capitella teleta]
MRMLTAIPDIQGLRARSDSQLFKRETMATDYGERCFRCLLFTYLLIQAVSACDHHATEERCLSNRAEGCAWCASPDFRYPETRCDMTHRLRDMGCALADIHRAGCPRSVDACRMTPQSEVCSGQGDCICGVCECHSIVPETFRRFTGQFCECNDYSCDYFDSEICGGPTRGQCECGTCRCHPGFTGGACGCTENTETCISASNGLICNGKGRCQCGQCVCDRDGDFRGNTCEECPSCPSLCSVYKDCVMCTVFASGKYSAEECHQKCSRMSITVVDNGRAPNMGRLCRFMDDDSCLMHFSYANGHLYAERNRVCPFYEGEK